MLLQGIAVMLLGSCLCVSANTKNVLLIIIDDFRPEIGDYLGTDDALNPNILTPRINNLSSESMTFTQAYSQYPSCGPSRASFLTGRRPDTTQVYKNKNNFRDTLGNTLVTLPQYFKNNNYKVYGAGKVFHTGHDDNPSWTEAMFHPTRTSYWQNKKFLGNSWGAADDVETVSHPLPDQQILEYIEDKLDNIGSDAFFMAAGFKKPHLPFICPQSFFDKYPLNSIDLPANPNVPKDFPQIAWSSWLDLHDFNDMNAYDKSYGHTTSDADTKNLRRAYYACTSYIDDLVGKLLDKLVAKGLDSNTVVALMSDHGFHLGEHSSWTKATLLNLDLRVPMMVKIPGVTDDGNPWRTDKFVEIIDMFPTLVEAAGLPAITQCVDPVNEAVCVEGTSAYRLISDTSKQGKQFVLSQYERSNKMGYSIKDKDYHYVRWVAVQKNVVKWNRVEAEELYNLNLDPNENTNIAFESGSRAIMDVMSGKVQIGYTAGLPLDL